MGWFSRRKKSDVIDLTRLEKQGVIRRSQEAASSDVVPRSSSGVLDFTSSGASSSSSTTSSSSSGSDGAGALGFLSNLAGAADTSSSSSGSSYGSGSYTDRLKEARKAKVVEFNSMKIKLEDTEYKLERVMKRLEEIERKLANFQGRVGY